MAKHIEVVIVGGGIVGLATARSLVRSGVRNVVVLEAEREIAQHQTGRNSGVIHSGLYYRPGSLKARNCISGRDRMYAFCQEAGIPHRKCGKLVVALRDEDLPRLHELQRRGNENGLADLRLLSQAELRELEPEVAGVAGLHVKEAGIVDYGAVARAFLRDTLDQGGEVVTEARVTAVSLRNGRHVLTTSSGEVEAAVVVNCAGLQCDRVAKLCGVDPGVVIVPFRGDYFELVPEARELVRNPIYPVPDPAFPFLGVHLTPTIRGTVEAGPNAVLAFKREGYKRSDVSIRDLSETLGYSGFRRLVTQHWRYGLAELRRSFSKARFLDALRKLVPAIGSDDIRPSKSGVRAQAVGPDGALLDDFLIVHGERSVHVLNAPSPAATSSLSIGDHIAGHLLETRMVTARR